MEKSNRELIDELQRASRVYQIGTTAALLEEAAERIALLEERIAIMAETRPARVEGKQERMGM